MRLLTPSMARGELSPLLHCRIDLTMFQVGLAKCENFIVLPQGGVTRRPGWERLAERDIYSEYCRLIPFVYSEADSHVIVFGSRVALAISTVDGSVVEFSTPYFGTRVKDLRFVQSGNEIFITHNSYRPQRLIRYTDPAAVSATNPNGIQFRFEELDYRGGPWIADERDMGLSGTGFKVIVSGGMYQLESTKDFFKTSDRGRLFELNYSIKERTIEIRANATSQYKETYNSAGALVWQWVAGTPPFYSVEILDVGSEWFFQTYDNWTGTITVQRLMNGGSRYDPNAWEDWRPHHRPNANDVGNAQLSGAEEDEPTYYRLKAEILTGTGRATLNRSGYTRTERFEITRYIDPRHVELTFKKDPDSIFSVPLTDTLTRDWRIGAWGGTENGYPAAVAIYQDRLCLAGSKAQPQGIWMSATGDYQNFGTTVGNLKDDDAISLDISSDDMSGIHSLYAGSDLIAFTASSEWRVKGAGDSGAITPTAIVAHKQSNIGSASIQPFDAGGAVIFAQTNRHDAYTFRYTFELDGYQGSNLSIMSEHILREGKEIVRMCYQKTPDSLIWFVLADGSMATCTFQMEHQVFAWARQTTDGIVGDVCCVPKQGKYDEVWAMIKRGDKWSLERLRDRRSNDEDTFCDGVYPITSEIVTLRIPQKDDVFHAKKYIPRLAVYACNSRECKIAPATNVDGKRWRRMIFPRPLTNTPQYEMVEADIQLDSGFERHAGVRIWTDTRDPLTIIGISPELTVGG